ncbi:hypothetical protein LH128_02939 [Sphingomonas sp. LH128]|uniref:hypothetical protein n=1 Tax=Sphingomonas sp. LH128 TaxID=473781 RepID=UPI00027CAA9B|nr:hypothetical protein [Sphingomonas sp. LH128]EJU14607.1 hypothetical protein LH128_02939 [Sphingomonas sp. LH128]
MWEYDAQSQDAERNLEIVTTASPKASLCLALCTIFIDVHSIRENDVRQCLDMRGDNYDGRRIASIELFPKA